MSKTSKVIKPKHYDIAPNGWQVLDSILWLGIGFCIGNALKYLFRAGRKDAATAVEDLEKAKYYIERELELRRNGS